MSTTCPGAVCANVTKFLGTGELVAERYDCRRPGTGAAYHPALSLPQLAAFAFSLAKIAIRQVWHQRLHRDPGLLSGYAR